MLVSMIHGNNDDDVLVIVCDNVFSVNSTMCSKFTERHKNDAKHVFNVNIEQI